MRPMPILERIPEIQFVGLLFALFVFPKLVQRFRIPSAATCVALGAVAGMGLGLFRQDATVGLLSTLGIVALFLFAGLDVDFDQLRINRGVLLQHLLVRLALLVVVGGTAWQGFGFEPRAAALLALALTTPSTGFILDSLPGLGVSGHESSWIRSKAIAAELLALLLLFLVLQPPEPERAAGSVLVLVGMIAVLPLLFRFFAARILPFAPKSEFAFLLMLATTSALVTRALGAYYLIGAFVVGIAAQRFRRQLPAMASEQMVHAVEVFASFFIPVYFFHAGVELERDEFSRRAVLLGLGFAAILVPLRLGLIALHRRVAFGESLRDGMRIGVGVSPTLVFTLVIAGILRDRFEIPAELFGALVVYALVTTLLPGFLLGRPYPGLEEVRAPAAGPAVPTNSVPGSGPGA